MTQKDILDALLKEIKHIKAHMPNGELKQMMKDMENMKEDLSDLKYTLLNPENGVIVKTNQNTTFRKEMEANEKDFQAQMAEVEAIKRWKEGVTRALWIIFGTMAAIIIRMIMMHSDKI